MMIPKLLTPRISPMARSRSLSALCSLVLLGTAVACGETNDPEPDRPSSRTERNRADDDNTGTRGAVRDDDDGPTANAGDDDEDLSIDSDEEVERDLGISGGRTRAGGGGGGRSRGNGGTSDLETTVDGGVVDAGDAGDVDVDAGDVDVEVEVVDAGVDEVVDAGDAGVAQ